MSTTVMTYSGLVAAIQAANAQAGGTYTISLGASITLGGTLPTITMAGGAALIVDGGTNDYAIGGQGSYREFCGDRRQRNPGEYGDRQRRRDGAPPEARVAAVAPGWVAGCSSAPPRTSC